jgi:hypothetical protein
LKQIKPDHHLTIAAIQKTRVIAKAVVVLKATGSAVAVGVAAAAAAAAANSILMTKLWWLYPLRNPEINHTLIPSLFVVA